MTATDADHAPTLVSAAGAVSAAVVAAVSGIGGSGVVLALAPGGALLVGYGLHRADRRTLGVGCLALLLAVLVTATRTGATPRLVVAVGATLVAWDLGEHAVALGEQLGRAGTTWRLEFLHAGAAVAVATAGTGSVLAVFALAAGGQPLTALVFLVGGAVALLATLARE